jgi:hypothetical protein
MNDDLVKLEDICESWFGVTPKIARRKAALGTLPVPAFRLSGTRRGPLFVSREALNKLVADRQARAQELNERMMAAGAV